MTTVYLPDENKPSYYCWVRIVRRPPESVAASRITLLEWHLPTTSVVVSAQMSAQTTVTSKEPAGAFVGDRAFMGKTDSDFLFEYSKHSFADRDMALDWIANEGKAWWTNAVDCFLLRFATGVIPFLKDATLEPPKFNRAAGDDASGNRST